MTQLSQPRKRVRRALATVGAAAGCVAVPKCVGCVVAYLGLGAALGLRPGIELCGATASTFAGPTAIALAVVAVAMAVVGAVVALRR